MSFFVELKRRNVFRVAIAYAVVAWLVLQIVDVLLNNVSAPAWVFWVTLMLLAIGFAIVVVFAWVFEMTPEGLKLEKDVDRSQSVITHTRKKLDRLIIGVLVLAVGYFAVDKFVLSEQRNLAAVETALEEAADEPEAAGAVTVTGKSIAVLPFVNMSNNEENEYFADGLTETLLHMLAQVSDLKVAARTSSFAFKGSQTDIREIADKLHVAHVLEGSVQRSGNQVRITAQLIQASDGYHLWSQTFDRDLDNIFAVQDEIATQVASALTGSLLTDGSGEQRSNGGTENTEAYDFYLLGREAFHANTERQAKEAKRYMRRAIALDPDFALAWAGLAEALWQHATLGGLSETEYRDEYRFAAEKAAELAPDNSQVLSVLGEMHLNALEMVEAKEALERAISRDASNANAWSRLANMYFYQGQYREAAEAATRAMNIDPLDFDLKGRSGFKFTILGQADKAEMLAQAVLENDPQSTIGLQALGNVYWRTGRLDEAYRVYHRALELNPDTLYIMNRLAITFIDLGDWETARQILQKVAASNPLYSTDWWNGDVRSWLCYITDDMDCVHSVLEQRIALADDERERIVLRAELARYDEDWETVWQELSARIESPGQRESLWAEEWVRQWAALAADRLGRMELRDELIEAGIDYLDANQAEGCGRQYKFFRRSYFYALRGDTARAVEDLQAAVECGHHDLPAVIHLGFFDAIIDEPEVQSLLERMRAINARDLKRLHATVEEVGPAW